MPEMYANKGDHEDSQDELERLLTEGVSLQEEAEPRSFASLRMTSLSPSLQAQADADEGEEEDEGMAVSGERDVQGALGLFAEAAQDLATAGVELGLGRHFACADFCNQAAEKAVQAVSLLRFGRRSMYNHDLRALGELV